MSAPNLNLFVKFLTASSLASSLLALSNFDGNCPNTSSSISKSPSVPISSPSATNPAPIPPPIPIAKYFWVLVSRFNLFALSIALTIFAFGLAILFALAAVIYLLAIAFDFSATFNAVPVASFAPPYNCVKAELNLPTASVYAISSAPFWTLPNIESSKYFSSLAAVPWSTAIPSGFMASTNSPVNEKKNFLAIFKLPLIIPAAPVSKIL